MGKVLPIVGMLRCDSFFVFLSQHFVLVVCSGVLACSILCWRCDQVCSSARFCAGGVLGCT